MGEINWENEFKKNTFEDWRAKALKEVKNDHSKLKKHDEIEETSTAILTPPTPLSERNLNLSILNSTNDNYNESTSWKNGVILHSKEEKEINKVALKHLMNGIDLLFFEEEKNTKWEVLLKGIELKYIHTQFKTLSFNNTQDLIEKIPVKDLDYIAINHDIIDSQNISIEIINQLQKKPIKMFVSNGYKIQQCGANTWQEIAYILSCANEMLILLMQNGLSIDKAASCIHFTVGIGSNYFMEIAKIRALRYLWDQLINAYKPTDIKSTTCLITAHIGLINKSLKDPHTNVLRQTTESMSAIIGGVDHLIVHPYDELDTNGPSDFATKLGINISLLLKEEAKFGITKDPQGGSYLIEHLSDEIAKKAWNLFQKLDGFESIMSEDKQAYIKSFVSKKAALRISKIKNKDKTIIGVNNYFNPKKLSSKSTNSKTYLGLKEINYESITN
ncbi:MAG: methylmalonyl-CoA mutase family protein [Crocinitomicaceae bacterium]|nr:methylmalonyl-CoA mutase family protein [Crocinitomicaceae bacterium]